MVHARKGQMSVEFIIILTSLMFILLILVSINFDVLVKHQNQLKIIKVKDAVNDLHSASELVYNEGSGAKTRVFVNIPRSIEGTSLSNNRITINLTIGNDQLSIGRNTYFPLQGSIPEDSGYYWMNVTSFGNYVKITY